LSQQRNYVSVLFVTDGGKVLLLAEGDQLRLASRMSTLDHKTELNRLCDIFDVYLTKQRSGVEVFETTEEDGVKAVHRYLWAVVKHPEDKFLRHASWHLAIELEDKRLSELTLLAIAMARTEGVLRERLAEAA
jgi:hypothetical protein